MPHQPDPERDRPSSGAADTVTPASDPVRVTANPRAPWRTASATPPTSPTNPDPATPLDEVRLAIGRIVGAHGVRGEVKMEIVTDEPQRLLQLRRVYFNDDPTPQPLKSVRLSSRQALLTFTHIIDRNAADALRGTTVRIAGSQARPPGDDEFFHYQLIGLAVYREDGSLLGTLTDIITAGEVDVYDVRDARGNEHLFPALREVVLEIDPAANRMVVRPQEWETPETPDKPARSRPGSAGADASPRTPRPRRNQRPPS